MPKIRIGLSTDFNLAGEQVGIGTTNPTARVDVAGQILAKNTGGSGGVSTYREYQGFHQTQSNVSNTVLIDATDAGNLNSLSGEIKIDGDVTIAPDTSVTSGKIDSLTATDKFAVPLGETNSRDNAPEAGTIRFNQDFGTLEFFDGVDWKTVNSYARYGAAGRGVLGGGHSSPVVYQVIDYINISTTGNAQNFGDLTVSSRICQGCASAVRGLHGGGTSGNGNSNHIDYVTMASTGNAIDFGDTTGPRYATASFASGTRGLFAGGYNPSLTPKHRLIIDYVEIATTGDAKDFGDPYGAYDPQGFSSPTRGVFAGGQGPSPFPSETKIHYVTIASLGNSIKFGDLTVGVYGSAAASNSTRGIVAGGYDAPSVAVSISRIDYVTIASTGNATHFGDLALGVRSTSAVSNNNRVAICGGITPSSTTNSIQYITISSTGDAQDFGDLTAPKEQLSGFSDSHGGLGGF